MTAITDRPLLLKVGQAAALLGIGRSTAYELIAEGQLPCVRIGSVMRVPRAALEAWIASCTLAPAASRTGE